MRIALVLTLLVLVPAMILYWRIQRRAVTRPDLSRGRSGPPSTTAGGR